MVPGLEFKSDLKICILYWGSVISHTKFTFLNFALLKTLPPKQIFSTGKLPFNSLFHEKLWEKNCRLQGQRLTRTTCIWLPIIRYAGNKHSVLSCCNAYRPYKVHTLNYQQLVIWRHVVKAAFSPTLWYISYFLALINQIW